VKPCNAEAVRELVADMVRAMDRKPIVRRVFSRWLEADE
jgi:hypothetical protein